MNRLLVAAVAAVTVLPAAMAAASSTADTSATPAATVGPELIDSLTEAAGIDTSRERSFAIAHEGLTHHRSQVGGLLDTEMLPRLAQAEANLDAANAILELLDEEPGTLPTGVAVVELLDARHHRGTALPGSQDSPSSDASLDWLTGASTSELLETLAERHGIEISEEHADQLDALDQLPDPLGSALETTVRALVDLDATTRDVAKSTATGDAAAVEIERLLHARGRLLGTLEALVDAIHATDTSTGSGPDRIDVPGLVALDLDGQDTTYTEDYHLLIDIRGDDAYENNAGGSRVGTGSGDPTPENASAALLLDLDGEDIYADEVPGEDRRGRPVTVPRSCGVNGGGCYGVGTLVDLNGSDTYEAGREGVNGGASLFGLGLLLDLNGDDVYSGDRHGANGGASNGAIGRLVDLGGDDAYRAEHVGVNGGGFNAGDGALVDASGTDGYDGRVAGVNGGAAANGHGLLVDGAGADFYGGWRSAANGGAVNGAVGTLVDDGGSDAYRGTWWGGSRGINGGARASAVAVLVDTGGGDRYMVAGMGANGGAREGGAALLVDGDGEDAYIARHRAVNGGAQLASSLLVDAAGEGDTYYDWEYGSNTDRTILPRGHIGGQVDLPHLPE